MPKMGEQGGEKQMTLTNLREKSAGQILRALLTAFSAAFLIAAVCAPDRAEIFTGFVRIISKPGQLTKDYFCSEIGSLSGALLNMGLVGLICNAMMFLPGAAVGSGTVAAYMLTVGFSSFGMNVVTMLPMILGTFVYSLVKRQPFAKNINFAMFSTALAPLIGEMLVRYPNMAAEDGTIALHGVTFTGVLLALLLGVVIGMVMPALCGHSQFFHKGYDLYNAGPAAGFLGLMLVAILYKTLGVDAPKVTATLGDGYNCFCITFCAIVFILCLIFGLVLNGGFKGYGKLILDPGHKADFVAKHGVGATIINFGVYGLFILAYYIIIGAKFTGPTFAVVFCMLAFCAGGATPLNVLPILVGYFIGSLFGVNALNAQAIIVGACFASGLAPISGHYGPIAGVVAGILHYCLVTSVPAIHNGFNLYNGGFTSGLVAFVLVPVLESFFKTIQARKESR